MTSLRFTEWSMGEGVLYNLVFTEWRHCVSQNTCTCSRSHQLLTSPAAIASCEYRTVVRRWHSSNLYCFCDIFEHWWTGRHWCRNHPSMYFRKQSVDAPQQTSTNWWQNRILLISAFAKPSNHSWYTTASEVDVPTSPSHGILGVTFDEHNPWTWRAT